MTKTNIFILAATVLLALNALADELAVKSEVNTNSFLSESGIGGMCRGGLHIISSPLLVPTALYFGLIDPFKRDPEIAGSTNYFIYTAEQLVVAPVTISANTAVGAGGCLFETISGFFDVISLGNYDLPENDSRGGNYDSRPYFIQFAENGGSFSKPLPEKQKELIVAEVQSVKSEKIVCLARRAVEK